MNQDYPDKLERQIDRVLKSLPDLKAPETLRAMVMQKVALGHALPWYRRPWLTWPPALRFVTLGFMLASFGALLAVAWQLTNASGYSLALDEVKHLFSGFSLVWKTVAVLLNALVVVVKHLGTGFMVGCLMAAGVAYAICIGLGTICFRLVTTRNN